MKLLIIEDEAELRNSMVAYLKEENYVCEVGIDCKTARAKMASFDYDCILLDISLTDGNGIDLLKELQASKKNEGVIIVSARNSIHDRIVGLNLGADDYISKPFHLSELTARIAAVIRRRRFNGKEKQVFNELSIDLLGRSVLVNNNPLSLTRKEYDLLLYLASNKNRVVSKNAIAEYLSGDISLSYDNADFIYSHMKNLKRKLQDAGCSVQIRSLYGVGYKFEVRNQRSEER